MIRYDRKDEKPKEISSDGEESVKRKQVKIDVIHMKKIADIFIAQLKALKINNVDLVSEVRGEYIKMNPEITLTMLSERLGKKIESKEEFVKEYYMYMLDKITDEAYGESVTAIQEYPYAFQAGENTEIIHFEFIS